MIRHTKTNQVKSKINQEAFNNHNINQSDANLNKITKFYDKQLMIQKLSYPENVSVDIHQSSSFHLNPKILIDEAQFSIIKRKIILFIQ